MHYKALDKECFFIFCNRGFTLEQLRKGIIQASGGYVREFYFQYLDMYLEDILEAIELTAEIHKRDEGDGLWQALFDG